MVALAQGRSGLDAVGFELMRPIRPMLASTAGDAASAVAELGLCSVEWKLDGVRIQAHRLGHEVRLWTRNLNEVTGRLDDIVEVVRSLSCHHVALDGEVMGLAADLSPAMFQDTMGRVGAAEPRRSVTAAGAPHDADDPVEPDSGPGLRLAPVFFDALHLEGRDLLDEPLAVRLEHLAQAAPDHRVPGVVTDDPAEAERVFASGPWRRGMRG